MFWIHKYTMGKNRKKRGEKAAEEVKLYENYTDNLLPTKPLREVCRKMLMSKGNPKISFGFMKLLSARVQQKTLRVLRKAKLHAVLLSKSQGQDEEDEQRRVTHVNFNSVLALQAHLR